MVRRAPWFGALAGTLMLLFAFAPARAEAATVRLLDVEALTQASDVVVFGQVVDQRVGIGTMNRITTWWTIAVDAYWVGGDAEPATTVVVRQWGGELDGAVEAVPGDARLSLGEHVVVFARGAAPDDLTFTALAQSVFHVEPAVPPGLVQGWPAPGTLTPLGETSAGPMGWGMAPRVDARSLQLLDGVAFYDDGDVAHRHGVSWSLSDLRAAVEAAAAEDAGGEQ